MNKKLQEAKKPGVNFLKQFLTKLWSFVLRHKMPFTVLLLLTAWLPFLISAYPGIVTYDQGWSILQFFGSGSLSITTDDPSYLGHFVVDHKPFLFTLIIGAFVKVGGFLGSQNLGLFALVIAEAILMAYVLALALRKLWRSGLHRFSIGALVFLAVIPIIPAHIASPTNDNIFAALFLWWIIILFDIVQNRGKTPLSKSQFIKLIILSVLLPLFKKIGIYIILITFVVLLIPKCYRLIRKQVAIIIGIVVASALIVSHVVYPIMDIAPGGKQEALGPVFHQTAAYVTWHPSATSLEDKDVVNEVLDYECLSTLDYDKTTHDPAKRCYKFDATSGELAKYLYVWASQGIRHPITYIRSWWGVAKDYVFGTRILLGDYTDVVEPIETTMQVVMDSQKNTETITDVSSQINLHTPEWAVSMRQNFQNFLTIFDRLPLSILTAGPIFATWIPIVCFVIIMITKRKWILWLLPVFLTFLVIFISPLYLPRYVLPMFLIDPFLIGVAILAVKQRGKREKAKNRSRKRIKN